MKLGNLSPSKGAISKTKRLGRGNATGQGRTAGKGHKGQQSRSGAKKKLYFEGGQTPLARRLPKVGMGRGNFNHLRSSKKMVQILNLNHLSKLKEKDITPDLLYKKGMIKKNLPYKILANGSIEESLNISANMFSEKAIDKIKKAGGTVNFI